MVDVTGYLMVVFLLIVFIYGSVRQIQHTVTMQKANKTDIPDYKRSLFGNYVTSISSIGFLISYLLNVLVGIQIIQSNIVTSDNSSFSCFIFLLVLLIAKFGIIPKNRSQIDLLN